jgi:cobyrinic acid a,c-diamide synthase
MIQPSAFLIAGTHSGAGKTTTTLVLLAALRRAGLRVQPFKVGPDFIDAGHHTAIAGRDCINLDLWMMGPGGIRRSFRENAAGCDVAVIEGMGALFDGENGVRDRGSAAHVSRLLGVPVVLVMDVWGMTRSTGAVLDGFLRFDSRVRIAGVVFNRVGSQRHYEMVLGALAPRLRRLSLGYIRHDADLALPERHLGVVTVEESGRDPEAWSRQLAAAAENVDMAALRKAFYIGSPNPSPQAAAARSVRLPPRVCIGVARDRAFCFYYAENLRMLQAAGAELRWFSPLDECVPDDVDGVYVGGGYPESFAAELEANDVARSTLARLAAAGMPLYAECGGLMYLGRSITGFDGRAHQMAAVLPVETRMDPRFLAIRYVEVRTTRPTLLGPAGTVARGQEFHQSRLLGGEGDLYDVRSSMGDVAREGFAAGNTVASYVHLHFRSNPSIPRAFVRACRDFRASAG